MTDDHKDVRQPDAAYDVSEMASAPHRPQQDPPTQPAAAPPQRSAGMYVLVGILCAVVLIQGAYISYLHWGVKNTMNRMYGEIASSPLLQDLSNLDLGALDQSLQGLEGLDGLEAPDKSGANDFAPAPEDGDAPKSAKPAPLDPLTIDPNAEVTTEQLLGLLNQLQGAYGEAFRMLEDPNLGVQPNQPPRKRQPSDVIHPAYRVEESPVGYRVEVTMPDANGTAITVDTKDGALVISAPIDDAKRYQQRIPLTDPVDATTIKTAFEDGTLVITARKATGGPVKPAVAA